MVTAQRAFCALVPLLLFGPPTPANAAPSTTVSANTAPAATSPAVSVATAVAVHQVPAPMAASAESFQYRWRLTNFFGVLARLFLPSRGDGTLSFTPLDDETLRAELLVTSEKGDEGEYWRYAADIDRDSGLALRAWSDYRFRGEEKHREGEIAGEGVLDVASAIFHLRRTRPTSPVQLEIWSDGKIYPVIVLPLEREERSLADDSEVTARRYSIRGVEKQGRRLWKGRLELWLADDEAATPVEIEIERSLAGLRLSLAEG